MPFYRVRAGQELSHLGQVLPAGSVLDLNISMAKELSHKLEPCTKDGQSLAHLNAEDLEIAQALPHERQTLEARKAARRAALSPEPAPETKKTSPAKPRTT